jgi:hypothetical protein
MKWFRKHIKTGSRLALFALAIQFALSFGHFHAQAAPTIQTGLSQANLASLGTIGAHDAANEAARKRQPSNPDNDQHPTDGCAICAVIAMASTALFSAPPNLLLPGSVEILHRITDAEFGHLKSAGTAFQPRAPPAS